MPSRSRKSKGPEKGGAWLPWALAGSVCRLNLPRASVWQVYLAALFTAQRYGGEARLTRDRLAVMTGLSPKTVQRALTDLQALGLIRRTCRYGRLRVNGSPVEVERGKGQHVDPSKTKSGRVSTLTPRKGHRADPSPTVFMFLCLTNKVGGVGGFLTQRQQTVVADVLAESEELLDSDPLDLTLPDRAAKQLNLDTSTTFRQALVTLVARGDRSPARAFVRAVLALRNDPRVQGEEVLSVGEIEAAV